MRIVPVGFNGLATVVRREAKSNTPRPPVVRQHGGALSLRRASTGSARARRRPACARLRAASKDGMITAAEQAEHALNCLRGTFFATGEEPLEILGALPLAQPAPWWRQSPIHA